MDLHESAKELCANYLEDRDNCPDDQECRIGEYAFKYVDLVVNFPGGDHVEHLHEYKHVEDNCQVS